MITKKPWIEKLFFMVSEFTCMGFSWGFLNSRPIKNHEFSVNGWILMVHEKWNGFWWHFHYPWIMPLAYFSWERQRVSGLIKKKKKKPQSAVCMVCVLTWLHFSMVYDSVNQAINDKKSVIAIQNSSGIHVHTSSTVSPFQAAIMMFQISPLKMDNKFQGFHPI